MRTTSSVESFNAVLLRSIAKRPHFFKFLSRMKYHESRKADEFINLAHTNVTASQFERRKMKDKLREKKIKDLTEMLNKNGIDAHDFLELMVKEDDCMFVTIFFNRSRYQFNLLSIPFSIGNVHDHYDSSYDSSDSSGSSDFESDSE